MHEFALVDNVFQILNRKITELDIKKISQVKLVIGEMTAVEETTFEACFEVFAQNTVVEGAKVVFERIPLRGKCQKCGQVFKVEHYRFECPDCANTGVEVVSGREFYIDSFSAE